jgi:lysophospholipase L1-like esterase
LSTKLPALKNIFLSLTVFFSSLFLGEMYIRFIHRYPLTYSEENGRGYSSSYLSQPIYNFRRLYITKGNKDLLTFEFVPYEKRDISSISSDEVIRPTENYNILGLRGPLPSGKKKIVACFGDSFTEGACAIADSCYPAILASILNHFDKPHDVINAGISGNDPFYDFQMLKKLSSKYNISTAVFLMNGTDLSDVIQRGGNERFVSPRNLQLKPTPWWERIYAVSFIFRLYVHNVLKLNYQFKNAEQEITEKQASVQTLANLFQKQIIPYCKSHNINVVVAQHPLNWEMQDTANYISLESRLQQLKGICYVNTYDSIKLQNTKQPLYYKLDLHFNHEGYRIIAKNIYEEAVRSKML